VYEPGDRQLGGPPCVYVGHPLLEHLETLRPSPDDARRRAAEPALVLALPGSRPSEIRRLSEVFGETLGIVAAERKGIEVVLPTLPHLVPELSELTSRWPTPPRIVTSEADKCSAFRHARAALAASGTVTLELALAGVPTVAAYRIAAFDEFILRSLAKLHPVIRVRSVILANIVLGEFFIPEFLQGRCTPQYIAPALADILRDSPGRRRQIESFKRIDAILGVNDTAPSARAATAVLDLMAQRSVSR